MENVQKQLTYLILLGACALQGSVAQTNDSQKRAQAAEPGKYYAQRQEYAKSAASAYSDEQARAQEESCPDAKSTYDINQCLERETAKTMANYKAYMSGLRSEEGLQIPGESSLLGPTGQKLTAADRLRELDETEVAWQKYYEAQCAAAYDHNKPGTIAPSMEFTCRIRLMRDRMEELESIYEITGSH